MLGKPEKLKPTKNDYGSTKKYFLLFKDSKFSPRHGMKVKNLFTVLQLNQSQCITNYIKKISTKNDSESRFCETFSQLMKDAFCRKAIEIVTKRINLDLIDETDT